MQKGTEQHEEGSARHVAVTDLSTDNPGLLVRRN